MQRFAGDPAYQDWSYCQLGSLQRPRAYQPAGPLGFDRSRFDLEKHVGHGKSCDTYDGLGGRHFTASGRDRLPDHAEFLEAGVYDVGPKLDNVTEIESVSGQCDLEIAERRGDLFGEVR